MQAIRRIGDAGGAARFGAAVREILHDSAGLGVEDGDGLWRAHLQDGGGVRAGFRVQRDGLGAGRGAEVDLGAGGRDDGAVADDPRVRQGRRVVRALHPAQVLAGGVRRERYGLSSGERRKAQPRRQQADERYPKTISKGFSGHIRFSSFLNL